MVYIGKMIGETILKAAIMFMVMEGLRKLLRKKEQTTAPAQN